MSFKFDRIVKTVFSPRFYKTIFFSVPRYIVINGYKSLAAKLEPKSSLENSHRTGIELFLTPSCAELSKKLSMLPALKQTPRFRFILEDDNSDTLASIEKQIYPCWTVSTEASDYTITLSSGDILSRDALFELALEVNVCARRGIVPSEICFGYRFNDGSYGFSSTHRSMAVAVGCGDGSKSVIPKVLIKLTGVPDETTPKTSFPTGHYMFGYPNSDSRLFKKIVVYKPDDLGDSILAIQSIRKLKHLYPESRIDIVCPEKNKIIWENQSEIDNVLVMRPFKSVSDLINTPEVLEDITARVQAQHYDLSINMRFQPDGYGHTDNWAEFTVSFVEDMFNSATHPVPATEAYRETAFRVSAGDILLRSICAIEDSDVLRAPLLVPQAATDKISSFTGKHTNLSKKKLTVGVCPGSSIAHKNYPLSDLVKLIDELIKQYEAEVFIIGTQIESEMAAYILENTAFPDFVVSAIGEFDILGTTALMQQLDLFIGNDTGPSHIAGIQNTPVLTICHGGASQGEWAPMGRNTMQIIRPMHCSPCFYTCSKRTCITEISHKELLTAVEKLLLLSGKL